MDFLLPMVVFHISIILDYFNCCAKISWAILQYGHCCLIKILISLFTQPVLSLVKPGFHGQKFPRKMIFAKNDGCTQEVLLNLSTLFIFQVSRINFFSLAKWFFFSRNHISLLYVTHAYNSFARKFSHFAEALLSWNQSFTWLSKILKIHVCSITDKLRSLEIFFVWNSFNHDGWLLHC